MKKLIHRFLSRSTMSLCISRAAAVLTAAALGGGSILWGGGFQTLAWSQPPANPNPFKNPCLVLEVYTAPGYSHSGTIQCKLYTKNKNGKETYYASITMSNLNDQNVSIGTALQTRAADISRIEITATSASSSNPWKPEFFRLIEAEEKPEGYFCSYPNTYAYQYKGKAFLQYKSVNYQFRSSAPVSFYTNPTTALEKQTTLTPISEPVDSGPKYLAVSIQSSGEPGSGLDPEGLAAVSKTRTKNNNTRELKFQFSYRDKNDMPRSYEYYPYIHAYYTSKLYEMYPKPNAKQIHNAFAMISRSFGEFDAYFNVERFGYIPGLLKASTRSRPANYIQYQKEYYKYRWFSQGSDDIFLIPVPDFKTADSYTLSVTGIEDAKWKVTGVRLFDAADVNAMYQESYLKQINSYTNPPLYSSTFPGGITLASHQKRTSKWTEGGSLTEDLTNTYIVSITTSPNAGTNKNLTLRLSYMDINQTKKKVEYNVRTEVANYLGVQQAILQGGQTNSFRIQLADVQQFLEASFQLDSAGDDWQIESIVITKPTSIQRPSVTNPEAAGKYPSGIDSLYDKLGPDQKGNFIDAINYSSWGSYKSDNTVKTGFAGGLNWVRQFEGEEAASSSRRIFLQGENIAGTVSFIDYQNAENVENLPTSEALTSIPAEMSYEEAARDLQLTSSKAQYQINVHVDGMEDAGSSNYFFFQLVFEHGTSGVVLANEQLESDGFRQGRVSTFRIQTNQNYGAVKSIRIYTYNSQADVSGSGADFDKLNISKIEITKSSGTGVSSSWVINGVGWIDIGYVEQNIEGDSTSIVSSTPESSSSVCKEYFVTELSASMDFLMVVKTGGGEGNETGNETVGALTYLDKSGSYHDMDINLTQYMHEFNENPSLATRRGREDRLLFSITDVSQILSLQLEITGDDTWVGDYISIYRVSNVGPVYVNDAGNYVRDYDGDFITKSVEESITVEKGKPVTVIFEENKNMDGELKVDEFGDTSFTVAGEELTNGEELLNFYVFLSGDSNYFRDSLYMTCRYTTAYGGASKQFTETIPAGNRLDNGAYYLSGISITDLASINGITLSADGNRAPGVDHAIVERLSPDGELRSVSYLNFGGVYLINPTYAPADTSYTKDDMTQEITFQIPASWPEPLKLSKSNDIGVSLEYLCAIDGETIHRSPYTYLTSQDITILNPGSTVTLKMTQPNVGKITGISLVTNGEQELTTDRIYITNTDSYGVLLSTCGTGSTVNLEKAVTVDGSHNYEEITSGDEDNPYAGSVTPVTLTFATSEELNAGTSSPVAVDIVYALPDADLENFEFIPIWGTIDADSSSNSEINPNEDDSGEEEEEEEEEEENNLVLMEYVPDLPTDTIHIPDIRPYLQMGGTGTGTFETGSRVNAKLMLYDIGSIMEIHLQTEKNDPWKLNSVTVSRVRADGTVETGSGAPRTWVSNREMTKINVRIPELRDEILEAEIEEQRKNAGNQTGTADSGETKKKDSAANDKKSEGGYSTSGPEESSGSDSGSSGGGSGPSGGGSESGSGGSESGSGGSESGSGGSESGSGGSESGSGGSESGSGGSESGSGGSESGSGGSESGSGGSESGSGGSESGSGGSESGSGGSESGSGGSESGSGGSESGSGGGDSSSGGGDSSSGGGDSGSGGDDSSSGGGDSGSGGGDSGSGGGDSGSGGGDSGSGGGDSSSGGGDSGSGGGDSGI